MSAAQGGDVELKITANGYSRHEQNELEFNESTSFELGVLDSIKNGNIVGSTPFTLLVGEVIEQTSYGKEANIYLTNYRLFIVFRQCFYNIPVRSIEYVEMREILNLQVICKDGRVVRVCFDSPDKCSEWWGHVTQNEASQSKTEDLFAFKFHKQIAESHKNGYFSNVTVDSADGEALMFVNDNKRMGFDMKAIWRTTEVNSKFEVCNTYPKLHVVPAWITDDDIHEVAKFRSLSRFPSVVWRNKSNGSVIARSSQPELGWFGWRCEKDENLLSAIAQAARLDSSNGDHNMTLSVTEDNMCSPKEFLLLDARSYPAAVANRAKGGGCECQEYYPNCDIQFMGLPNIHAIRKSFQSVRALCLLGQDQSNWYSALEATKWLQYLSGLIRSSLVIVEATHVQARSTLVHCSDGWDRTAQLVSLAELLLDPYYRTIKGFRVLIEREWLVFGHKFADRCGHSVERDMNERSPVFFQWLDVVHQCMKQFPYAFEFNETFLMKLLQHVYGCLFGTFLCNNARERRQLKLKSKTVSVWDLLLSGRKDFYNYLYASSNTEVLHPSYHLRSLELWENAFMPRSAYELKNVSSKTNDNVNLNNKTPATNGNSVYRKISKERKSSSINIPPSGKSETNESAEKFLSNGCISKDETHSLLCNGSVEKCQSNGNLSEKDLPSGQQMNGDMHQSNGNLSENDLPSGQQMNSDMHQSNGDLSENDLPSGQQMNGDIHQSNGDVNTNEDSINNLEDQVNALAIQLPSDDNTKPTSDGPLLTPYCMTDSARTLTNEIDIENHKSLDDSCLLNSSPHSELVTEMLPSQQRFHRVYSSPDSPTINRLQRTKSVPDVMAVSAIVHTEHSKYYAIYENRTQEDLEKDFSKYIDIDGLTFSYNYMDEKLLELHITHASELAKLQKTLEIERQGRIYMQQQQCARDGTAYSPAMCHDVFQDDLLSLPDSLNGERSSVSSISNEDGWEQVQFDDVQPTRWLPDHLSPTCLDCSCTFNIMYRRHHCRKCGGLFCDTCSNFKISLPEEQLYNPVRVCARCYQQNSNTG